MDKAELECALQSAVKRLVHIAYGSRRKPICELLGVKGLEVLWHQLRQEMFSQPWNEVTAYIVSATNVGAGLDAVLLDRLQPIQQILFNCLPRTRLLSALLARLSRESCFSASSICVCFTLPLNSWLI